MKNTITVKKVLFSLAVVLLAVAACGGEPSEREQKEESRLSATGDCELAPAATITQITETLTVEGGSIRAAHQVRSKLYNNIYMVAADIEGPGLDGPDDIGVWASGEIQGTDATLSWVNSIARDNSELLGGSQQGTTRFTPTAHGIRESIKCAQDELAGG